MESFLFLVFLSNLRNYKQEVPFSFSVMYFLEVQLLWNKNHSKDVFEFLFFGNLEKAKTEG